MDTSKVCSICFEDLGDNVKALVCSHTYHSECIEKWMSQDTNSCPLCRSAIDTSKPVKKLRNESDDDDLLIEEMARQSLDIISESIAHSLVMSMLNLCENKNCELCNNDYDDSSDSSWESEASVKRCDNCKIILDNPMMCECRKVRYCDRECQREDWSQHKRNCIPISQRHKNRKSDL